MGKAVLPLLFVNLGETNNPPHLSFLAYKIKFGFAN